jgi:hypothetical protein
MALWAQQNHKIKTFSIGPTIMWFPKGKKFKKWWFGSYKIQYFLPNNTVLFINIEKFELNPILVNINKLKPYRYLDKILVPLHNLSIL